MLLLPYLDVGSQHTLMFRTRTWTNVDGITRVLLIAVAELEKKKFEFAKIFIHICKYL